MAFTIVPSGRTGLTTIDKIRHNDDSSLQVTNETGINTWNRGELPGGGLTAGHPQLTGVAATEGKEFPATGERQ